MRSKKDNLKRKELGVTYCMSDYWSSRSKEDNLKRKELRMTD